MKRLFILLALLTVSLNTLAQRYLINTATPVSSYMYKAYGKSGGMDLAGGLDWGNGFSIGSSLAPYKPGYAVFKAGKEYSTMKFVLGRFYDPESLDYEPAVITVYADGRKIADEIVRKYDVPRRMELDIRGADELKFVIIKGEDPIGFAEVTLWKDGETPEDTGNLIRTPPTVTRLVQDLKPYALLRNS